MQTDTSTTPSSSQGTRWHHTMLRVKDPAASVDFYTSHFGMTLLDKLQFPDAKFDLYFLATLPEGSSFPAAGTAEAHAALFAFEGVCLELTHNYGTEKQEGKVYHNGNSAPRGFGHIAFNTNDVYAACETLEKNGAKFQKKPNEGRMKGLAFVLDPDEYWVEIVSRGTAPHDVKIPFNLSQTMIRVKSPESVQWYSDNLGMTKVCEKHFESAKFSLYFLASLSPEEAKSWPDPSSQEASDATKKLFQPVLELTHNHGTELEGGEQYVSGNEEPKGFGHVAFVVDDLSATVAAFDAKKIAFKKRPEDGSIAGIAFAYDDTGYWVELIQKGLVIQQ